MYLFSFSDWPLTIALSSPDHVDVIEDTESVSSTCTADCNPVCDYRWVDDNGTVVSTSGLLDIDTPDRYQAGEYTCWASNTYGELPKVLTVNVMCKLYPVSSDWCMYM